MRLHHLRVQAFQAFAGTEEVDFDALSDAGLFLLRGETGAGKTTLLDAVTFALYGTVPGVRGEVARLRSDHAAAELRTEVTLEATLRGRRVRVTRSPKQQRPKVRGPGLTDEQPSVRFEVLDDDGGWRTTATRADEAKSEVLLHVGMTAVQFCQVVLLPQGQFADFLRAKSEDRRELLEQLFEAQRFADAEGWLKRRADEAWRASDGALRRTRDVVAAIGQAAASDVPDGWELDPAAALSWAARLAVAAGAEEATASGALKAASAKRIATDAACAMARELADRRRRHAEAVAEVARYEGRRASRDAAAAELADAGRAAPLGPLLEAAEERAVRTAASAEAAVSALAAAEPALALAALAAPVHAVGASVSQDDAEAPTDELRLFDLGTVVGPEPEPEPEALFVAPQDPLRAAAAALRDRAGGVRALAPVEARLSDERDAIAALEAAASSHEQAAATASAAITEAREEHTAARLRADAAAAAVARVAGAQAQALAAQQQADAARTRDRVAAERDAAQTKQVGARRSADDARATWLDLREARLTGMAAELAGRLEAEQPCAVCGSLDHPAPAEPGPGGARTDADAEAAAQQEHERCAQLAEAAGQAVAQLDQQLAAAAAVAGDGSAAQLADLAAALLDDAATAERAAAAGAEVAELLAGLEQTIAAHEAAQQQAVQAAVAARAAAKERSAALEQDAERLAAALDGAADVATRTAALDLAATACEDAADARDQAARDQVEADAARVTATERATKAGFPDLDAALKAARSTEHCAALEAKLQEFDQQLHRLRGLAEDPELVAASKRPAPELERLEEAQGAADAEEQGAQRGHALAADRVEQLSALGARLQQAIAELTPLVAHHRRLNDLAKLVDGTSSANARRMRLSAYVLAARLEEIADAASERLGRMSHGRYALVHCDEGLTARGRAGLELRVVDGWTGQERHPGTLSGGETFLASLALALGLADVVAAEAGGARLETLFVDEGFGSLDERALEEVLDVLDRLRDGGRAVGIVSHVAELRDRIPAQVHVVKGRDGSTVRPFVPAPA